MGETRNAIFVNLFEVDAATMKCLASSLPPPPPIPSSRPPWKDVTQALLIRMQGDSTSLGGCGAASAVCGHPPAGLEHGGLPGGRQVQVALPQGCRLHGGAVQHRAHAARHVGVQVAGHGRVGSQIPATPPSSAFAAFDLHQHDLLSSFPAFLRRMQEHVTLMLWPPLQ